ncbi:LpqB family beta-propeller domain-containing protein, partial [Georgenia sp. 10Sc9-8]|nr:LpqB family beta-propeller domain-containing protein [Georgenia halotolerans]
ALGEPVRLGEHLTDATDTTWVDEVTVAVLGVAEGEDDPVVHLLPLGGPTTQLPEVEGAVSVAAARGDRTLVVGTESGELYVRNGAGWRLGAEGVRDPAYPG